VRRPPRRRVRAPEEPYTEPAYPSWPSRVLAAVRVWATFEWLYPYRDLMQANWDDVLKDSLVRLRDARDAEAYHLAIAEMVAPVGDTHAVVVSAVLEQFWGPAAPAVALRPVEGRPVIVRLTDASAGSAGVTIGDVVLSVDGIPADQRLATLSRYIAGSTPQALQRDAVQALLRGPDGSTAELVLQKPDGTERRVTLPRSKAFLGHVWQADGTEPFRLLPRGVGYIDLRLLLPHQVDAAFDALQATKGLIFDMRGYPNGTQEAIAARLTNRSDVPMPLLWLPVLLEPGGQTRHEFRPPLSMVPQGSPYSGKTVMLIDDRAQSQSEHTALILRAVHGTVFVGCPTTGANGEGSNFIVPGGIFVGMTGVGVSHPDGAQLQRIGILPDIPVHPTINGIRAGRDEVLERAVRYLEDVTSAKD
jgi:C-terminal processing protease CtpA/Prc